MRVCFIAGSRTTARCGISDYVDLLSLNLQKIGHKVENLEFQKITGKSKVSSTLPDADVFSVQFAPYAFSHRGLAGKSLVQLATELSGKNTHINFHEVWIGAYSSANWKEKICGWRQKKEILKFLKRTKPKLITSTNSAGIDRLKNEGIYTKHLYLFGNVPFSRVPINNKPNALRIVFFGTLYQKFPYELLAKTLNQISKITQKKLEIQLIGRQREGQGLRKLKSIAADFNFPLSETGELTFEQISHLFQDCEIGVSTTPYDVIGKSGTTAAMLEHGLPILTYDDGDTRKENLFSFKPFEDQIFQIHAPNEITKLVKFISFGRKAFFDGVAYTAKSMLDLIT